MQQVQLFYPRRKKMFMGSMGINVAQKTRPWVAAWWSVALPGFGHIHLGMYIKGFILMAGEIVFNLLANVNQSIYYTFLGQFEQANQVLNHQWTTLYCAVFVFSIFDAYRLAVEINKMAWLESKQAIRDFTQDTIRELELNAMDKRIPWVAAFWSFIFTGLGHVYSQRIVSGFIMLGWTVAITYHAKLHCLVTLTMLGQFDRLHEVAINYEWALFFPSIYCFGIIDAYEQAVTFNRLFKEEQAYHFQKRYGKNPIHIHYGGRKSSSKDTKLIE